jgi:hypothetical protein
MSDRLFFALAVAFAALAVCLALVWPQGLGARSWGPFGRETYAERQAKKPSPTPPPAAPTIDAAQAQLKGGL